MSEALPVVLEVASNGATQKERNAAVPKEPGEVAEEVSGGSEAMIMGFAGNHVLTDIGHVAFLDLGSVDGITIGDEFLLYGQAVPTAREGALQVISDFACRGSREQLGPQGEAVPGAGGRRVGFVFALPQGLEGCDEPLFALVEATEGWEPPGARPSLPYPDGFRINRALTRIPGVLAQTNSDEGVTILWSAGSHQSLPPGLAQLYTPGARALMAESTVTVTTLDGGPLPLYLARVAKDGLTAWVVAFSPEAVLRTALALP